MPSRKDLKGKTAKGSAKGTAKKTKQPSRTASTSKSMVTTKASSTGGSRPANGTAKSRTDLVARQAASQPRTTKHGKASAGRAAAIGAGRGPTPMAIAPRTSNGRSGASRAGLASAAIAGGVGGKAAGTAAILVTSVGKGTSSKKDSGKMSGGKAGGKPGGTSASRGARTEGPFVAAMATGRSGGGRAADAAQSGSRAGEAGASGTALPNGYRPTDAEPFMNERQRLYFRNKLIAWKEEIVRLNRETLQGLHEDSAQHADVADRATFETDRALELRARDRQRKLISKIDAALARIEEGTYGYCEETGEPISLKRLDARPIATLSIEAQERHERRERVFREE